MEGVCPSVVHTCPDAAPANRKNRDNKTILIFSSSFIGCFAGKVYGSLTGKNLAELMHPVRQDGIIFPVKILSHFVILS